MRFRLVPKSVTLNDLERCNGHVVCIISPNLVAFGAYYIKTVEDTPTLSASKMKPKESSFQWCIIYGNIHRESPTASVLKSRKSHMGFRSVPKLVTLNDLEWRNGHYFAEFGSFRGQLRKTG